MLLLRLILWRVMRSQSISGLSLTSRSICGKIHDNQSVTKQVTDYRCDICWYLYASWNENLEIHKSVKYNTDHFLGEWLNYWTVILNQESLGTQYGRIYERETFHCTIRLCHNSRQKRMRELISETSIPGSIPIFTVQNFTMFIIENITLQHA